MVRRAVFAAFLLLLLSTASVAAATRNVSIYNYGFKPATTQGPIGMGVAFKNTTASTLHSTTSDFAGLWTDDVAAGTTTTVLFWHSGAFPFHCRIHLFMKGTVKVKPTAAPTSGGPGTKFTVKVQALTSVPGWTQDIQKRKAGGTWQTWQSTTGLSVTFQTNIGGTYQFRSRERRTSDNATTGWSPAVSIQVI